MRITAKVDYAVRAMCELAAQSEDGPTKADVLAGAQDIPTSFLENILSDLKRAGLVMSQRGPEGGHRLGRPAKQISVADVVRAVEGPLADVRGQRPETVEFSGNAERVRDVYLALRVSMRNVLEKVTIADIVADRLPRPVRSLLDDPEALRSH